MLITVVMPAYNARPYLAAAVQSVLDQTLANFEFRIYDDGSTDGSTEMLQQLAAADSRIVLRELPHQGYAPLLNLGLAEARGEFFARMDADDLCEPDRFARQLAALHDDPRLVAVGCATMMIDADGDPLTVTRPPLEHEEIDRRHLRGEGGSLPHPTLMARTAALREVGGYRPEFEPAEDLDLLLRLAERGRLANLAEPLLRYRVHAQMTSIVWQQRQAEAVEGITTEARRRRGLPPIPAAVTDHATRDDSSRRRCLRAFDAGFYGSALKYAARHLREQPWRRESWSLLTRMTYVRLRLGSDRSPRRAGTGEAAG